MVFFRNRHWMVMGAVFCLLGSSLLCGVLYGSDPESSQVTSGQPVILHYKIKAPPPAPASSPAPATSSAPPSPVGTVTPASPSSTGVALPSASQPATDHTGSTAGSSVAPAPTAAENAAPAITPENKPAAVPSAQPSVPAGKKAVSPPVAPEASLPPPLPAEKKHSAPAQQPKVKKPVHVPVKPHAPSSASPEGETTPAAEHPAHHAPASPPDFGRRILNIQTDNSSAGSESIQIVLTGFFPPETQVIEGETPKIICDFPNVRMDRHIQRDIAVNGKFIQQIRTGIHPPPESKSRIVIDLVPQHDYEVEQLYYQKDNIYSMVIREKKTRVK